ncbi:1114_t:CDS:10 [Funneliformis geosporum]|nr:1114_t:CDS:10 [Funneliformis geosporum]
MEINNSGRSRPLSLPKSPKRGRNLLLPKIEQTRKLINQILIKLKKRKKPPSPFQNLSGSPLNEDNNVFNADDTCDLLIHLRDVLVQNIFFIRMSATPPESPYASREPSPNRSRSPSPSHTRRDIPNRNKSFGILERILEVLYDIVQNDCRYKVITPRPFRPPHSLHSIVLDVAHLLVEQNPYSPGWLYELGMAMIPGFNFFNDVLHARLLIFYNDVLIPHLMACQRELIKFENSSYINITINSEESAATHSPRSVNLLKSNADRSDDEHSFNRRQSAARKLSRRLSISYTGDLEIDAYYIDSMFTPLLYSIMQFISVENSSLETLYQMHRTIGIMVQNKPDLYNDVIEIIAHGDTISRNQAVIILFYFWRNSTGHLSIGEALPSVGYMHDLSTKEKKNDIQKNSKKVSVSILKDVHNHQFLPHIFLDTQDSKEIKHASIVDMHGQFIPTEHPHACVQCFKPVSDFGLRCGGCKLNVHFTCYNLTDGGCLEEYSLNSGVHKLSTPRYCDIIHGSRKAIYNDPSKNNNSQTAIVSEIVAGHAFRLANFFTLVLCIVCRMPLWGVMNQGYRCESCNKFIHHRCMKSNELKKQFTCQFSPMNEDDALIEREMLSLSFKTYYENILIPEENISNYSFEELSIMMTILQMQENILRNGIMAGCLIIKPKYHNPLTPITEPFENFYELQEFFELYRSYLGGRKVSLSVISSEYWEGIGKNPPLWLISCEDYLAHLASIMKNSDDSESEFVDRHLSVYTAATLTASSPEYSYNSTGILTIKEIMKWLRKNLGFHSSYASKVFLQQMVNYGFLEHIDGHPILFYDESEGKQLDYDVTFPLPFVIECSPTVESLITAISACLSDISISTNECGLLLMTRRCWPDSFLSRYVLERLMYAVIKWVCDEDDKLLIIAREYTPSHLRLPGVRDEIEDKRGCATQRTSSLAPSSAGGGAYIICRKMLREKYIVNWMSAIHDMNQGLFCDIVFDQIEMLHENNDEEDAVNETELQSHDRILKFMIRLWHAGLLFSAFNDMIARWLDDVYHIMKHQSNIFVEMKTLYKIFNVSKSMQRFSTTDQILLSTENYHGDITDPISLLTQLFKEGDAVEITRALQWMEVMVRSGVGLSGSIFSDFLPYLANLTPSIEQYVTFMEVMWYQVMNGLGQLLVRSNIQKIISDVNDLSFEKIQKINEGGYGTEIASARSFIKATLALSLYSYNCPLEMIYNIGIFDSLPAKTFILSQHKRLSSLKDSTPGSNITADNPLMLCLLKYARFEKLEVRGDIVKGFWRFYTSAGLIFNKNEFINNCIPKLLPSVWEELSPLYDISSDMTLQLLMRIVWADSRFFLASVSKVFEHSSWEIRFDGLDNLYGLFSKLEERHEIQRAGVFTYLGPIFSYLVGCLWDEEEFVRTKAISYIRSLQPRHVRLAFKCWEGYFFTASIREKTLLFIEWKILLDALTQENDEAEQVSTVDILESYMRPDSILVIGLKQQVQDDGNSTPGQRVAELQNLKVIMLTLALQMLANGIEMTQEQITTLKYLVVTHLGFKNVKYEFVNGKLNLTSIGDFEYIPDDFTQNMMMISCLGNLKRVLDAPIYLKASNNAEPEQEEELAGVYFVDVVLGLFYSSVDMSTLSHLMLKSWIELLLIIVYKHKIEEKRNNQLEEHLVSAMRKSSELLSKDITEENKQLIIEVSTTLLKRAPMLTVNILGKYIITLGKLLTNLGNDSSSSLVMSAKIFLRTAFLSFARNGLFVLIFKNQSVADETNTELDMFRVLREIIRDEVIPSEDENAEPAYLRVEPIRDVINQLFKFTNSKIVSTILYNLNRYVELVYSKPYSEQLMIDLGTFLTKLTKYTTEWKRVDWDVNPILNMISIIIKDNLFYAKHLIHPVKNFLKHVISKCGPTIESFVKVLAAYNAIIEVSPSETINVFGEVLLDEIKTFYKGARNRLNRDTLIILLQLVLWDMQPSAHLWFKNIEQRIKLNFTNQPRKPFFSNVSEFLFEDCITFLENPPIIKQYSKQDFKVGVCASQLAVAMCSQKYDLLTKIFLWQKQTDSRRTIRLLNWILLGILKADSSAGLISTIFDFQDNITDLLSIALKSPFNELETGDVNYLYTTSGELAYQSFVLVKIWTMLCSQNSEPREKSKVNGAPRIHQRLVTNLTMSERRFWNFIWPNIRKQLISVTDEKNILMFMDLITFLHLIGSDIVMLYSQEWCMLLDSLIDENEEENSEFHHKIKQARSMFDDPPLMMQQDM